MRLFKPLILTLFFAFSSCQKDAVDEKSINISESSAAKAISNQLFLAPNINNLLTSTQKIGQYEGLIIITSSNSPVDFYSYEITEKNKKNSIKSGKIYNGVAFIPGLTPKELEITAKACILDNKKEKCGDKKTTFATNKVDYGNDLNKEIDIKLLAISDKNKKIRQIAKQTFSEINSYVTKKQENSKKIDHLDETFSKLSDKGEISFINLLNSDYFSNSYKDKDYINKIMSKLSSANQSLSLADSKDDRIKKLENKQQNLGVILLLLGGITTLATIGITYGIYKLGKVVKKNVSKNIADINTRVNETLEKSINGLSTTLEEASQRTQEETRKHLETFDKVVDTRLDRALTEIGKLQTGIENGSLQRNLEGIIDGITGGLESQVGYKPATTISTLLGDRDKKLQNGTSKVVVKQLYGTISSKGIIDKATWEKLPDNLKDHFEFQSNEEYKVKNDFNSCYKTSGGNLLYKAQYRLDTDGYKLTITTPNGNHIESYLRRSKVDGGALYKVGTGAVENIDLNSVTQDQFDKFDAETKKLFSKLNAGVNVYKINGDVDVPKEFEQRGGKYDYLKSADYRNQFPKLDQATIKRLDNNWKTLLAANTYDYAVANYGKGVVLTDVHGRLVEPPAAWREAGKNWFNESVWGGNDINIKVDGQTKTFTWGSENIIRAPAQAVASASESWATGLDLIKFKLMVKKRRLELNLQPTIGKTSIATYDAVQDLESEIRNLKGTGAKVQDSIVRQLQKQQRVVNRELDKVRNDAKITIEDKLKTANSDFTEENKSNKETVDLVNSESDKSVTTSDLIKYKKFKKEIEQAKKKLRELDTRSEGYKKLGTNKQLILLELRDNFDLSKYNSFVEGLDKKLNFNQLTPPTLYKTFEMHDNIIFKKESIIGSGTKWAMGISSISGVLGTVVLSALGASQMGLATTKRDKLLSNLQEAFSKLNKLYKERLNILFEIKNLINNTSEYDPNKDIWVYML